jgi:hypothetical protein
MTGAGPVLVGVVGIVRRTPPIVIGISPMFGPNTAEMLRRIFSQGCEHIFLTFPDKHLKNIQRRFPQYLEPWRIKLKARFTMPPVTLQNTSSWTKNGAGHS